jgi:hypothetical protein
MKTPIGNYYPAVPISATDKVVLPAANRRRTITFFNPSTANINISIGQTAVYNSCINVPGNVGVPVCLVRDGSMGKGYEIGTLIDQEIHAISTGASSVTIIVTYDT